jgi:hypothetical protein
MHGVAAPDQQPTTSGTRTEKKREGRNKYNIYTLFSTFTVGSAGEMISPDAGIRFHRNVFPLKDGCWMLPIQVGKKKHFGIQTLWRVRGSERGKQKQKFSQLAARSTFWEGQMVDAVWGGFKFPGHTVETMIHRDTR